MENKFNITNVKKLIWIGGLPHLVWRIVAIRDIPEKGIASGQLGGYVEAERNLSQSGSCWIDEKSVVCGNACVYEHATVTGTSVLSGHAVAFGGALVVNTTMNGHSKVYGDAEVRNSVLKENASVSGNSSLLDCSMSGTAKVVNSIIEAAVLNKAFTSKGGSIINDGTPDETEPDEIEDVSEKVLNSGISAEALPEAETESSEPVPAVDTPEK